MTTPRINDFAAYMTARHNIYLDRKAGKPGPWTSDPILNGGRFCNIFRELDTVTIWVDKHIRKPFADHPHLWFMLAIARYINWPDTLAELIETKQWPSHPDFEPSWITTALEHRAARGEKVYTGAYMIRAESDTKANWYSWTKHRYIAEIVLGRLWEDREEWARELEPARSGLPKVPKVPTLESVWTKFQLPRYVGWGPFMAYEVVTDLRHTRYLGEAEDIYTWANAGPGAIRGLNRLYGRDLAAKPRPEQTNGEMFELMKDLNDLDDTDFNTTFGLPVDSDPPRFEMRDVEHTLCEFDKYERVRLSEGKMRSKYDWRKATRLA
jgi:hypothetical protein